MFAARAAAHVMSFHVMSFRTHPVCAELFAPWGEDVMATIEDRHNLRILGRNQPLAPQFAPGDVVED